MPADNPGTAVISGNGNSHLVEAGRPGSGNFQPPAPTKLFESGKTVVPKPKAAHDRGIERTAARRKVDAVLAERRQEVLGYPGVIGVRAGYKVSAGWVSETPAIVVTVREKKSGGLELPDAIDGVLIDVAPATPAEQLRSLPAGEQRNWDVPDDRAELIRTSRYVPPPHLKLEVYRGPLKVLCHTSPDAGWPNLDRFLSETANRLTIGMYDFTAPHIVDRLAGVMGSARGTLRMVVDPNLALSSPGGHGTNPKANDIDEDTVRQRLSDAVGSRLEFLWAAVKRQGKTTAGIFGSAYHIKVAVQDSRRFWLSSGNWQSSNQPNLDPLNADASVPDILKVYNREWHVIIDAPILASLFENFLEWDMEQARPLQEGPESALVPELLAPPTPEVLEMTTRYFEPREFVFTDTNPVEVVPLLSPDNYAEELLALIQSAQNCLYIQNQYLKMANENTDEFLAILEAIREKGDAGVDVRILLRDLPDSRTDIENLMNANYDPSWIKLVANTHTKGVIVDSKVVMIGSHNLSNDGVLYNRDASLIFRNEDIARYYERIFLYDWSERARRVLGFESAMPVLAGGTEAARAGYRPVDWSSIYED